MKHLHQQFGIVTHRKGFVLGEVFEREQNIADPHRIWRKGVFLKNGKTWDSSELITIMRNRYPDLPILAFDEHHLEPGT